MEKYIVVVRQTLDDLEEAIEHQIGVNDNAK